MTKKSASLKPKATSREAKTTEPEPTATSGTQRTAPHVVTGLPRFNFNARPATKEESMDTIPIQQTYESIQQEARGPGADEWRQVDKARSELGELYRNLQEDERYAPEYKSERAWSEYEKTKAKIEQLAPEAHKKMLRSAEGLERQSIPTPEGEGLITKDTDKLLLTAHERSRIEGLIDRAEKAAEKGPFKANPIDILKAAYEQGLEEGGPGGGATVRAVVQLARDYGLDVDQIVDKHRKPYHHGALEDAQRRLMTAELISRSVPEPPFKRGASLTATGTYGSGCKAFIPPQGENLSPSRAPMQPKQRKPYWR